MKFIKEYLGLGSNTEKSSNIWAAAARRDLGSNLEAAKGLPSSAQATHSFSLSATWALACPAWEVACSSTVDKQVLPLPQSFKEGLTVCLKEGAWTRY